MSVSVCVFLDESELPSCEQWQKAISDGGHDLVFDHFSTRHQDGFIPMRLNGEDCGFEYSLNEVDASEEDDSVLTAIGARSHLVTLNPDYS